MLKMVIIIFKSYKINKQEVKLKIYSLKIIKYLIITYCHILSKLNQQSILSKLSPLKVVILLKLFKIKLIIWIIIWIWVWIIIIKKIIIWIIIIQIIRIKKYFKFPIMNQLTHSKHVVHIHYHKNKILYNNKNNY